MSTTVSTTTKKQFSSKIGFIAAASGSAVGLSNLWKFPYEAGHHGGGAFLLLYLLCTLFIAMPLAITEFTLGKHFRHGVYGTYRALGGSRWGRVGGWIALSALIYLSFYFVITGWIVGYIVALLQGKLLLHHNFVSFFQDFKYPVWKNMGYTYVSMLFTTFIVRGGVHAGIERASKLLMPLLLLILVGLIGYGLTLPGALAGIRFYLIPRLSALTPAALSSALGQSFMSLALGGGILMTYGAYMRKEADMLESAGVTVGSDTLVAFLAGMLIFPFLFHKGVSPDQGTALFFVLLPQVFQSLGGELGVAVGVLFFSLMAFAAVTSSIALLEVVVCYGMERYTWSRRKAVWLSTCAIALMSLPSLLAHGQVSALTHFWRLGQGGSVNFLDFSADFLGGVFLPTMELALLWLIVRRWGWRAMSATLQQHGIAQPWVRRWLKFSLCYVCPTVIISILLRNIYTLCL